MPGRLTLAQVEQLCRSYGLPLTVQRRAVLEALAPRTDHPTADQLYEQVRERIPEISRTTVYRVLETFVRIGVARQVCHPGAVARYEVQRERHHHLVCLQCGRMVDLEDPRLDQVPLPKARARGFHITDYSIQFRGTCKGCAGTAAALRPPRRGRDAGG